MKYKRIGILLCIALLFSQQALAEKLYSITDIYQQAQSGWHETYESHGRTIEIDVPIHVPNVEKFPILKVIAMPEVEGIPSDVELEEFELDGKVVSISNIKGYIFYSFPDVNTLGDAESKNPFPKDVALLSDFIDINSLETDVEYSPLNDYTVNDATTYLREMLQKFYPEESVEVMPVLVKANVDARPYNYDKEEGYGESWEEYKGAIDVNYNQIFYDIPFINTIKRTFKYPALKENLPIFGNSLGISVYLSSLDNLKLNGEWYILNLYLVKEDKILIEDVPLCSLDTIKASYEKLIEKGTLRQIDTMRLGYVGYFDKKQEDALTLVPMWVVEGMLYKSAKAGKAGYKNKEKAQGKGVRGDAEYSRIMINAQTGELIDPYRMDTDRYYDIPKIIKWK